MAVYKDEIRELALIQPNRITNARYDFTAVQENIITLIIESIQKHMTRERDIQTDLFGDPVLLLKASEMSSNKENLLENCRRLREKEITFVWKDQNQTQRKTHTGIITTTHDIHGTDFIEVQLSKWAIPYLIYIGEGVGGTYFAKTIAITLKSVYAKRMYKQCKQWERKGFIPRVTLDTFKEILQIPASYAKNKVESRVLDVAREELIEHADISFDYSFSKERDSKTKKKQWVLNIQIVGGKRADGSGDKGEMYSFVYRFLCITYPSYKNDKARVITDKLAHDITKLRSAYQQFSNLDDKLSTGQKSMTDIIKITKSIINKDEFGITYN